MGNNLFGKSDDNIHIDGQELFAILEQIYIKSAVGAIQEQPERLSTFEFIFKGQRLHTTLIHRLNRNNQQSYFNLHVTDGPLYNKSRITNIYYTIWGYKKEAYTIHLFGDIEYIAPNKKCASEFEKDKQEFLTTLQNLISNVCEMADHTNHAVPTEIKLHQYPRPAFIDQVIEQIKTIDVTNEYKLSPKLIKIFELTKHLLYNLKTQEFTQEKYLGKKSKRGMKRYKGNKTPLFHKNRYKK